MIFWVQSVGKRTELQLFGKTFLPHLPGVNYINMFTRSFYAQGSQKHKKLLELAVFFALLGSVQVKAPCKMLVKLTPGVITLFLRGILTARGLRICSCGSPQSKDITVFLPFDSYFHWI